MIGKRRSVNSYSGENKGKSMTNQELRDRVRKEIIEEGKAIERRVEADESLRNVKMPEDSYEDLLRRAAARKKAGNKKGHVRKRVLLAVAVVAVLLVGGTLSATGARLFTPKVENRETEDGLDTHIIHGDEDVYIEVSEEEAYQEIEDRLGIQALRLGYKPDGMELEKVSIDENMGEAIMEFYYGDKILTVYENKQYDASNFMTVPDGEKVDTISLFIYDKDVEIWKVTEGKNNFYYRAEFIYGNAYYYLAGNMSMEEFETILSEIFFENV